MKPKLGATDLGKGRCQFVVWAPLAKSVELHLVGAGSPRSYLSMDLRPRGYFDLLVDGVEPGALYLYRIDGERELPDPASRFQPQGVHGPSQVVDTHFSWTDQSWFGVPLQQYVLYELHVGTFTAEGTFEAVIPHLDRLKDLGITAIELMPVAQFPGSRNWGYDGVYPFAVHESYGGPKGLKRLVDACHRRGMAAVLDVVYNHLGPEGNYLSQFGLYFTKRYRTPWGEAINFDGPHSDEVRRFFIENALYWLGEFHVDALRLDAVHAIVDHTAYPFLHELGDAVHRLALQLNRQIYAIPESSLNDVRLIQPKELGGFGLDAQWNDDFHHSLHTLLTGERSGYYADFGRLDDLAKCLTQGYVYTGQYSEFRRHRHGNASRQVPAHKFVICAQNHDQIGNRKLGERLSQLVSFEALKLAAASVILSPCVPMLFMGEEYGETAPFLYFISHSDPQLIEAVRRGRKEEFSSFDWQGELPDPQSEETFRRSKLRHELREQQQHRILFELHKELIRLRKTHPSLAHLCKEDLEVTAFEKQKLLCVRRWNGFSEAFAAFHFGDAQASMAVALPAGRWQRLLDSSDHRWLGAGSSIPAELNSAGEVSLTLQPESFVLFGNNVESKEA